MWVLKQLTPYVSMLQMPPELGAHILSFYFMGDLIFTRLMEFSNVLDLFPSEKNVLKNDQRIQTLRGPSKAANTIA